MHDLGVSYTFHFHKKNTESSIIFLQNGVFILNEKENKEATVICFEIRVPKKKKKELLRKITSKVYEVILLWKRTKKKFGLSIFPNIITKQWGYCIMYWGSLTSSTTYYAVSKGIHLWHWLFPWATYNFYAFLIMWYFWFTRADFV